VQLHGNSWHAIGAYHSESPGENGIYARAVEGILNRKLAARAPLPIAGQTRAQEPAPQPMQDGAKPMRPVVLKHAAAQPLEHGGRASNVPTAGADEHWLDAMLTSLNQSASLRDRFNR
jgi:hypothetical protein